MARVSGAPVSMPRQWYRDRIASGTVTEAHLSAALAAAPHAGKPASLAALQAAIAHDAAPAKAVPTVADLAAKASGIDWPGVIAERFGAWAGGFFDQGQALWAAPRGRGAYAAWQAVASHDLTPEIAGLTGFGNFVADAPERAAEALAWGLAALWWWGVPVRRRLAEANVRRAFPDWSRRRVARLPDCRAIAPRNCDWARSVRRS
jgi:uncharacterized protein YbcC (UPF0753/DUF2309 family)